MMGGRNSIESSLQIELPSDQFVLTDPEISGHEQFIPITVRKRQTNEKLTEARATVVWFVDLTKQIDHVLRPEWSFDKTSFSTLNGAGEDDEDLIID